MWKRLLTFLTPWLFRSFLLLGLVLAPGPAGDSAAQSPQRERAHTRHSFYMGETEGEILFTGGGEPDDLRFTLEMGGAALLEGYRPLDGPPWRIPFELSGFPVGTTRLDLVAYRADTVAHRLAVDVSRLPRKPNAVQVDRLTGGLVVDGLPFFPFGFYAYSPVQPLLPEEEVVKGFNLMSPYQRIEARTRDERRAYMDRCAELGMKVNFNLLSVAAGGGVGHYRSTESRAQQLERLREEVEAFRDHPALLAWYISDEPVGQGVPVEVVQEAYDVVREADPYHPVSVVFMTPSRAREYASGMDIVMADPYPIPNNAVTEVDEVARGLRSEFAHEKPVWLVPQAFGGGEWWAREPTAQELRVMTYLGLIHRATGVQYFIRHGMNAFPKSTTTWNEAGAIAREAAELTPLLLSAEPAPAVVSHTPGVEAAAWQHDGKVLVLAANTENEPLAMRLRLDMPVADGTAELPFENRHVPLRSGVIADPIDGFGTRAYLIDVDVERDAAAWLPPTNLTVNPSFEINPSVGTPAGCYVSLGADRGATYFVDPRLAAHGDHSLRLVTPREEHGVSLGFFPAELHPGQTYVVSVQARADDASDLPEPPDHRGWLQRLLSPRHSRYDRPTFEMSVGDFATGTFALSEDWQEYRLSLQVPDGDRPLRIGPRLELLSRGTAWFDLLLLSPDPRIETALLPESDAVQVTLATTYETAVLHVTRDGSEPSTSSAPYNAPFLLTAPATVRVAAFDGAIKLGEAREEVVVHAALGDPVYYGAEPHRRYSGAGPSTLVDGLLGSESHLDGRWQGFLEADVDVVLDLGASTEVSRLAVRFLQVPDARIFLPESLEAAVSNDGLTFTPVTRHQVASQEREVHVGRFELTFDPVTARYVRLLAHATFQTPDWHRYRGTPSWTFIDEVAVW